MPARGAGASARTGRHEDARAEPDILLDTRRSGACSDAPSCGASLTDGSTLPGALGGALCPLPP